MTVDLAEVDGAIGDALLLLSRKVDVACSGIGWRHVGRMLPDRVALVHLELVGAMLHAVPYAYRLEGSDDGLYLAVPEPSEYGRLSALLPLDGRAIAEAVLGLLPAAEGLGLSRRLPYREDMHLCPPLLTDRSVSE